MLKNLESYATFEGNINVFNVLDFIMFVIIRYKLIRAGSGRCWNPSFDS